MSNSGYKIRVLKNDVAIAGIQSKSVNVNNEAIDKTNDDDEGFASIHTKPGKKQLTISGDGEIETAVLEDIAFDPDASVYLTDLSFEFLNDDDTVRFTITGEFFMDTFGATGGTSDTQKCSFNFLSSKKWTRTPGP